MGLAKWAQIGRFATAAKTQRRLDAREQEIIYAVLAQGQGAAELGRRLGRDASVISREIARHGGRKAYSGGAAQARACRGPAQTTRSKTADSPALLAEVRELLVLGTAPKQIEVALAPRHPEDDSRQVSHETIYDFIYVHAKERLRRELIVHLRRQKPRRSPVPRARAKLSGQLPGAVNIRERPAEVEGRAVPGHWEAAV